MTELLCNCSWEIPGVVELPWHLHRAWATVELRDGELDGKRIRIPQHDLPLNPKLTVIDQWEEIRIPVDWEALYRARGLDDRPKTHL